MVITWAFFNLLWRAMAFSRGCYALYAALGLFRYSILGKLLWLIYLKKKKNFFYIFSPKKFHQKLFFTKNILFTKKYLFHQKKIPQRFTSSNFFLTFFFFTNKTFFSQKNSFSQLFLPVFLPKNFFLQFFFSFSKKLFSLNFFPLK